MKVDGLTLFETSKTAPLKVYCDVTVKHPSMLAAAGWLFLDHAGRVLDTSGCTMGRVTGTTRAEVNGMKRILNGLEDYDEVQHVKLYTDCKPAVKWLAAANMDIGFESATVEWVPREENQISDMLADRFFNQSFNEGRTTESNTPFGVTD